MNRSKRSRPFSSLEATWTRIRRYAFGSTIALTFLAGVALRSLGYLYEESAFWFDEAFWAIRVAEGQLWTPLRPVGYLLLSRALLELQNSELTLRLPSFFASVASIPLAYLIGARLFESRVTVFCAVVLFAANPLLVLYAKEFKPYSVDLLVHLGLLWLTLRFVDRPTGHRLYAVLSAALAAVFFSTSVVFLYPSVFILLFLEEWRRRDTRGLRLVAGTGVAIFAILLSFHFLVWEALADAGARRDYWGNKYGVFCPQERASACLRWLAAEYWELIQASGVYGRAGVATVTLAVVHACAWLGFVARKDARAALLLGAPIAFAILFNLLGYWPFGWFRSNLFLVGYFLLVCVYGMEVVATAVARRPIPRLVVLLALGAASIVSPPPSLSLYHDKRGYHSEMPSVLSALVEREGAGVGKGCTQRLLLADAQSRGQIDYYINWHEELSPGFGQYFVLAPGLSTTKESGRGQTAGICPRFLVQELRLDSATLSRYGYVWVLFSAGQARAYSDSRAWPVWMRERAVFARRYRDHVLIRLVDEARRR